MATLGMGYVILAAAGLSFLGLGAQPPTPVWGAMLNIGRDTEVLKAVQQINSVAGDLGAGCNFYPRCPEAGSACKIKPELREVEKGHYVACRQ